MPVCRECQGTGRKQVRIEVTTRCPECGGTKLLDDGSECKLCNQWGQIGAGEFRVEEKLCTNCMGSGQVSEGSVTVWFLIRAAPATLLILGGGGALLWFLWTSLESPLVVAIASVIIFGGWGGLMAFFINQMPTLGEISVTNWFLIRAVPTTLVALGAGGPAVWAVWKLSSNAPATAILMLAVFAVWGVLMYFFISHLPN